MTARSRSRAAAAIGGSACAAIGRRARWRKSMINFRSLPPRLAGTLVCDWSRAEAPGHRPGPGLCSTRLADAALRRLDVRHGGAPPHDLELLQKLKADRNASRAAPEPAPR